MHRMKILIIEDEPKIGYNLEKGLKNEGYETQLINDGDKAMDEISKYYDLVLIDIMLPGVSGIEIAKHIKIENPKTKIIFLTSKSMLEDKLYGFENGADDYITKPFSYEELLARIKAVLRRENQSNQIKLKDLIIDLNEQLIYKDQNSIKLSKKEFDILKFLAINKEKVFNKEEIIEKIWGIDADVLPNTVEVFVKSIRDKVEKPFGITVIETIRGFGYKIKDK